MDSGRHMGTLMVQVAVVVDFAEPDQDSQGARAHRAMVAAFVAVQGTQVAVPAAEPYSSDFTIAASSPA